MKQNIDNMWKTYCYVEKETHRLCKKRNENILSGDIHCITHLYWLLCAFKDCSKFFSTDWISFKDWNCSDTLASMTAIFDLISERASFPSSVAVLPVSGLFFLFVLSTSMYHRRMWFFSSEGQMWLRKESIMVEKNPKTCAYYTEDTSIFHSRQTTQNIILNLICYFRNYHLLMFIALFSQMLSICEKADNYVNAFCIKFLWSCFQQKIFNFN